MHENARYSNANNVDFRWKKIHWHIFLSMKKKNEIISLDRYFFLKLMLGRDLWLSDKKSDNPFNCLECDNFFSTPYSLDVNTIYSSIELLNSFEMAINVNDVFQYIKLVEQFFFFNSCECVESILLLTKKNCSKWSRDFQCKLYWKFKNVTVCFNCFNDKSIQRQYNNRLLDR